MNRWTPIGIYLAYVVGAIPLSVWICHLALRRGKLQRRPPDALAVNIWRDLGWPWGVLTVLLDFLKGVVPVGLAHFYLGFSGWALVAVALAPVLGHTMSPFLNFQGRTATSVSLGIWAGLAQGYSLLLAAWIGFWRILLLPDGWAVMLGMVSFWVCLLFVHPESVWMAVWAGNVLILTWTERRAFHKAPTARPWLQRLLTNLRK